jgi:AraC-like DNA-binding protein
VFDQNSVQRLNDKSPLHALQVELQQGYALSPVEAQVLAQRLREIIDEQTGYTRDLGQIIYQAIAVEEPAGKALKDCRKVPVQLTLFDEHDPEVLAQEGPIVLRRIRVHRLAHEALMQGGALSQEDLAALLGVSLKSIKRIFADYRDQGTPLPARGEIQDMGRGVSHKIPVIRRYVQDLSFTHIARELNNHGIQSMARYLRHFALVMILEDRGLSPQQMQSVIGISLNLIEEYRQLYHELNQPEYQLPLERLKRLILMDGSGSAAVAAPEPTEGEKRGTP